jgi:hypothetical protein
VVLTQRGLASVLAAGSGASTLDDERAAKRARLAEIARGRPHHHGSGSTGLTNRGGRRNTTQNRPAQDIQSTDPAPANTGNGGSGEASSGGNGSGTA